MMRPGCSRWAAQIPVVDLGLTCPSPPERARCRRMTVQVTDSAIRSRVLILSAHSIQLDRRIAVQANALVQMGREVVLVSVPTHIPEGCLDSRIRVIVPTDRTDNPESYGSPKPPRIPLHLLALRLLKPFRRILRPVLNTVPWVTERYWRHFFLNAVPKEPFDVIHCHDLQPLPAACIIAGSMSPRPRVIYDSHELFPYQYTSRISQMYWMCVERRHSKYSDRVITVNQSIADHMQRAYSIKKPEVIYNSYDPDLKSAAIEESLFLKHFGADADGIRVVFQGGFTMERNLEATVRAFGILPDSIRLFLLGDGPAKQKLKALCGEQRIGNVHFGNWVPQVDLLSYLAHAHIGLIPYTGDTLLNNRYCTPNKLFEFMEVGLPICASDLVELRKIVKGMRIGDVYQMSNPEQIAAAVKDFVARLEKGEFVDASFRAARDKFGWSGQREKLLALYEALGV
jgi:glycosyltransferase involved in cell wall biosynthesis